MIIYIISTVFFFLFHLIQLYFSTIDPLTMSSCNNIVYHRTVETAFFFFSTELKNGIFEKHDCQN